MGLASATGLAQAQVYASAPSDDTQAPLVLSNFASEQTPVLVLAQPAPAPVRPVMPTPSDSSTTASAGRAPSITRAAAMAALVPQRRAPTPPAAWLPLFASVAREHSVPASLLLAVAAAESGFNPRARSPKGALGLMQLMPATARERGVQAVWSVTDNLRGGAAHLRLLLNRFAGRPELAVAAYNAGEQAVINAGTAIPNIDETQRYVPKVLAWHAEYESMIGRDRSTREPRRTAAAAVPLRLAGTP